MLCYSIYSNFCMGSQIKNKRKGLTKKEKAAVFSASVAVEQILMSFGNSALAECGGYSGNACLTITPQDFCVPESSDVVVNSANFSPHPYQISLVDPSGDDHYITYGEIYEDDGLIEFTPDYRDDYNNYPDGPPADIYDLNYDFTFTSPAVSENTGTISLGNGRDEYSILLFASTNEWDGAQYLIPDAIFDDESLTLSVDHVNTAPVITSITPAETFEIDAEITTTYEVSAAVNDLESNIVDITFELSDQNDFSNITDTATYESEALSQTDQTFSHTWTGLTGGIYFWRVIVTETNASGVCTGFSTAIAPNNLTASSDSNYIIVQPTALATLPEAGIGDGGYSTMLGIGILLIVTGKFLHTVFLSMKNSIIPTN